MPEQLSPGLTFEEPRSGVATISGVSTAVGGFIGIAERGPINKPILVGSTDEFDTIFGGAVTGSYLRRSVKAFFDNGGSACYIVRVGHYATITDPSTLDAVKAWRQLTSNAQNSMVVEASSEGEHGNSLSVTTIRQDSQVAVTSANTGTSAITSQLISDVRRLYVGAQVKITGAIAAAGTVLGSSGPFNLKPGEVTRISIDQGTEQVYTWGGTRGRKDGSGGTFAGVAGTVTLRLNEDSSTDQVISFAGTENTEALALAAFNNQWVGGAAVDNAGQIRLQSDRFGSSSQVRVVAGTAGLLTDLGLTVGTGTAGTATLDKDGGGAHTKTIAFLDAATATEVATAFGSAEALTGGTLVAVGTALRLTTSTTGASPKGVQVKNTSTELLGFATTEFNGSGTATIRFIVTRIDNGAKRVYFSSLTPAADIPAGTAVVLEELDILAYRDGAFLERISQLAMNSTAGSKYFMTVVNNNDPKRQIAIRTDNGLVAAYNVDPRPDNQSSTALLLGSDGTTPNDTDHIGDPTTSATAGGRGLYAFDTNEQVNIIAIPGRTAAAVHAAMITYAEARKDVFMVLDAPSGQTPQQIYTYVTVTANLYSEFAALYYPWIKTNDPDSGVLTAFPPCGEIMGVYARTDAQRGVQKAPAGTPDGRMLQVLGVEKDLTKADLDLLYPANINPIISKPGKGVLVYGSRTLSSLDFRQINVRRVFIFVERSIRDGAQWVVFEPSDSTTRARLRATVSTFLLQQWRKGVLKGDSADQAFYVTCDESNNPPSVELAGQLVCLIGLAIARPAEFVTFKLVQDTRAVDAELAAAGVS